MNIRRGQARDFRDFEIYLAEQILSPLILNQHRRIAGLIPISIVEWSQFRIGAATRVPQSKGFDPRLAGYWLAKVMMNASPSEEMIKRLEEFSI